MKGFKKIIGLALLVCLSCEAAAKSDLNSERLTVIREYVKDLGKGDAIEIKKLFAEDGYVVSTSRGKVAANTFFDAFLPLILVGNTALHAEYSVNNDSNRLGARFHFDFLLNDGEQGGGEYVDEFVFSTTDPLKIQAVYMFENLVFAAND